MSESLQLSHPHTVDIVDTGFLPEEDEKEADTPKETSIHHANKDELRDKIHQIHNFLRNHGAGYGMNALKVFNIVYGLHKIEKSNLFERFKLDEVCRFSTLLQHALHPTENDNAELLHAKFFGNGDYDDNGVLDKLYEHHELKNILFYEIPRNMTSITLVQLFKEIRHIEQIEENSNVQLAGKIYEYFIGRDKTAISELGAYFTDRHITDFIFNELAPIELPANGDVPEMVDMFGGSGGFTISYAKSMITQSTEKNIPIDWSQQLSHIHHYDMNEDVIRSAALELLCITGSLPIVSNSTDMQGPSVHMGYKNSFKDEFQNKKFQHIYTNPPYGGDDSKGTSCMVKRKKLIAFLTKQLQAKEVSFTAEQCPPKRAQLKRLRDENLTDEREQKNNCVSLDTGSRRLNHYALTHGGFSPPPVLQHTTKPNKKQKTQVGLCANDKEGVSLLMMMDMLAPGGTAVGVLKEGVFFNPKYTHLRAHLLTNYNVREIVSVPRDAFENTTVKTSIIVFDAAPAGETTSTDTVRFSEIVVDKCTEDKITELADGTIYLEEAEGDISQLYRKYTTDASYAQIATHKKWSLSAKEYPKEETIVKAKDGWKMVALGDVCEMIPGTKHYSSIGKDNGKYIFLTSSQMKKRFVDFVEVNQPSLIIGQGGNFNIHLSDCFTASKHMCVFQNADATLLKFLYFILPMIHDSIITNGSTISWMNRENIKAFKIPLPQTQDLLTHWTTRVSTPYDAKHTAEKRITEIETHVRTMITELVDTDGACDWVALGDVCEIKNGTRITKKGNTSGQYHVYGGGDKTFTTVTKNRDSGTTIIGRFGVSRGCVRTVHTDFFLNDSGCSMHSLNNENEQLVLETIKLMQNTIYDECTRGSAQKNMDMDNLKAFKIPLPKSPTFQTPLQPYWDELDTLRQQVKTHEAEYQQALTDLRCASIDDDASDAAAA